MKQLSKICIALLISTLAVPAIAQQIHKGQINVTSAQMQRTGDSLQVNMLLDISKLTVDRSRSLTLTPILLDDKGNNLELPDVVINGSNRDKSYQRSIALDKKSLERYNTYTVVKSSARNNVNKIYYTQTIPYQDWMTETNLDIKEVLCGCGGHSEEIAENRILGGILCASPPALYVPFVSYIEPQAEVVKKRQDELELFLNFPVNKTTLNPNYMGNANELARLKVALDRLKEEGHVELQGIDIEGYASPEGNLANNEALSKGRAEALKGHLLSRINLPSNAYSVKYGGENWLGLIEALKESGTNDRDELLSIVDNTSDVVARKNKLKTFKNGAPYRQMLTDIYPNLRKVVLNAHYDVQSFTVEEAKELIKTQPELLSLDEMYRVANSYPQGSDEYLNAMKIAVKQYPKDETANLNAAAAALAKRDLSSAEEYLKLANPGTAQYANNKGVFHLLIGDYEDAKAEFTKAQDGGLDAVTDNLKEALNKLKK